MRVLVGSRAPGRQVFGTAAAHARRLLVSGRVGRYCQNKNARELAGLTRFSDLQGPPERWAMVEHRSAMDGVARILAAQDA
jgi:hypothetical protein